MKKFKKKKRLIFLTLDPLNPLNIKLTKRLEEDFSIVIVTNFKLPSSYPFKNIKFDYQHNFLESFFLFFYKHIESKSEKEFIKRNVYRKYRSLINIMFRIKKLLPLPSYSSICFFLYKNKQVENGIIKPDDICITDATLRHTLSLNPLIVRASIITKKLVANVTSWDNPQYSTINTFAQKYLVWNKTNRDELTNFHKIKKNNIAIVGSIFHDYLINNYKLNAKNYRKTSNNEIVVLYAAIFPGSDEVMAADEVKFILFIGNELKKRYSNLRLIFRTYPSSENSFLYNSLREIEWIDVYEHSNYIKIPRLGNESEVISFNKEDEKIKQFHDVDVLLSAGSTFTIEFAFSNKPIIHINATVFSRNFKNSKFLERLDIYGHLKHLSPDGFDINVVGKTDDLLNNIGKLKELKSSGYNEYLKSFAKPYSKSLSRNLISHSLKNFF